MKKLFKLMALASAVFLLGACAEETVLTPQQAKDASPEANAIAFSTYMGKTGMTRAGATGNYTTDYLQGFGKNGVWGSATAQQQGFGVFAYYTGNDTYGQYQKVKYAGETGGSGNHAANFMFNQLVWWNNNAASDLITKWSYSPTKYWPNEVKSAAGANEVDDQNNNTSNDPATTAQENGGNVSFFAYAPYVDFSTEEIKGINYTAGSPAVAVGKQSGIVAINGQTTLNAANAEQYDPTLTYKLPPTKETKAVDLLWGTAGTNGLGVTGADNLGVKGNGNPTDDWTAAGSNHFMELKENKYTFTTYEKSILDSYRMNTELTKQTTSGTISFAFKHALAKIGGSYVNTGSGSNSGDDEDPTTPTNGLMVILDIDDMKGAEVGGALEKYLGIITPSTLEASSKAEWNKYNTKVTINDIKIECDKQLTATGATAIANNDIAFDYASTDYTEDLYGQGVFNLATGQWSEYTKTTTAYEQTIEQSTVTPGVSGYGNSTDDKTKDAILSEELAEPKVHPGYTKQGFESLPIGVTTVAKNVYETEGNPLVFIPGTKPIIAITITYTVRTYDSNLSQVYTEVKQKVKKRLYITNPVELNKQYNILMHLGLTSVKFTATVSNWDVTNIDDSNSSTTNPGGGQSVVQTVTEDVEHVYLPINVGDANEVVSAFDAAPSGSDVTALTSGKFAGNSINVGTKPNSTLTDGWGDIAIIKGVAATHDGGSSQNVELSHVAVTAIDEATGEVADWLKGVHAAATPGTDPVSIASITIKATENTTLKQRVAKLYVVYDNKAEEFTVKQYGRSVQATPTLEVWNTESPTAAKLNLSTQKLKSGAGENYTTKFTYKYKLLTNAGDETGDALPTSGDITTESTDDYVIVETTSTKLLVVDGTTFTTTANKSADDRTITIKATYGNGKDGTVDATSVDVTQEGATIVALTSLDPAKAIVIGNGETIAYTVKATLEDSKGLKYYKVDVTNKVKGSAEISSDPTGVIKNGTDKDNIDIPANTGLTTRTITVTLKHDNNADTDTGDTGESISASIKQTPKDLSVSYSGSVSKDGGVITLLVKQQTDPSTNVPIANLQKANVTGKRTINGSSETISLTHSSDTAGELKVDIPANPDTSYDATWEITVKVNDATGTSTSITQVH